MDISRILQTVTPIGKQKFVSLTILVTCTAVLWVAFLLRPDPHGMGTHRQIQLPKIAGVELHLPPCALYALTGIPCATCGMTTSFAYGIRGEFRQAFVAQPFGLVLFFVTLGLLIDSAMALGTNRSVRHAALPWKWIWLGTIVLLAAAWGYKIWEVKNHV